ncbi:hypothetical protein [Methylobacterium hispanicum]|uniref:hypothetical protein n=1 Tax=Methylobacterium hispanicum TaxID=270350 RepID=UPI002F350564
MKSHSKAFLDFRRQIVIRRRDLLRHEPGKFIFPPSGAVWTPTDREFALCEAFIVLFVAELETYLEYVINTSLDIFQQSFLNSGLADCSAGTSYIEKIVEKRRAWEKNNNTNWSRIGEYFVFVGMQKSKFPPNLWDDIEAIAKERGGIVHTSYGIRAVNDPRATFLRMERMTKSLQLFDKDFVDWTTRRSDELARLKQTENRFIPGIGSIVIKRSR